MAQWLRIRKIAFEKILALGRGNKMFSIWNDYGHSFRKYAMGPKRPLNFFGSLNVEIQRNPAVAHFKRLVKITLYILRFALLPTDNSYVRLHCSLLCLLGTTHFARALRCAALTRSLRCAHFAHSFARGKVNVLMTIFSVFFFYSGPHWIKERQR